LAEMEHLFSGLSYMVPEQMKLSILKRNVRQSYKVPLLMIEIVTVEDLRKFCRKIDGTDETLFFKNRPVENVKGPSILANAPKVTIPKNPFASGNGNVDQKQFVCFNCGGANHRSRDCMKKKPITCYGCGLEGHIRTNCPKCSGNGSARTG
jgi:Zinc knuckle